MGDWVLDHAARAIEERDALQANWNALRQWIQVRIDRLNNQVEMAIAQDRDAVAVRLQGHIRYLREALDKMDELNKEQREW